MSGTDRGDNFEPVVEIETPEVAVAEPEVKVDEPEVKVDEPEVKEPEAKVDEPVRDDKGRFIPKARFDEQVSKERGRAEAAERRAAELEAQLKDRQSKVNTEVVETEIVGLEKEYTKAVLQGDEDKAADLMREIRHKERSIQLAETSRVATSTGVATREQIMVDSVIDQLEASYPVLDEHADEHDPAIVEKVLKWQNYYMTQERMTPSKALQAAANEVLGSPSEPATASLKDADKGADKGAERKAAAVEKNIAAAKAQPASSKAVGEDSDKSGITSKVDYGRLTAEERAVLPESTKSRLRGDYFEG